MRIVMRGISTKGDGRKACLMAMARKPIRMGMLMMEKLCMERSSDREFIDFQMVRSMLEVFTITRAMEKVKCCMLMALIMREIGSLGNTMALVSLFLLMVKLTRGHMLTVRGRERENIHSRITAGMKESGTKVFKRDLGFSMRDTMLYLGYGEEASL